MGPMGVSGLPGPAGPAGPQGASGVVEVAFNTETGNGPARTLGFVGATVTVSTRAGQQVFVSSHKALGSTVGASNLALWVCYETVGGALNTVGGGIMGLRTAASSRQMVSLSAVTPPLDLGTTMTVGLCGEAGTQAPNWNSNDYGYTTALVFQP
jgi:hypothetical protein